MHKFFVPKENIFENIAHIEGEDVKHIYKVLRIEEGETVNINNCEGQEFLGKVIEITKKQVCIELKEELLTNNESPIEIYLYQGLPKSTKMDLIVQKGTELGIKEITPVITNRVIIKNEIGEFKKIDRWQRIALEACKQSKRSLIPIIHTPIEFKELLENLKSMDLILVPYENQEGYGLKQTMQKLQNSKVRKVSIIIGPEGGFEKEEINILKDLGAEIITLGPRILRTETAGFVCASLVLYELGDIGGMQK